MADVTNYAVIFYGSPDGYLGMRAQIALYDGATVLGYVHFHDPGMPFPADSQPGHILMQLPSAMFESVIEMLRIEAPVRFYFTGARAFLGTYSEALGEEEGSAG
ncbi:MAG TPA: hypothetical protein VEW03_13940 [Longimicrobiaceae bacterium]|nr:hypothetical protein [Longimicrobiaceae bacterium]